MFDCLILVERGVSEPDLVKGLLESGYKSFFKTLHADDPEAFSALAPGRERSVLADYGLATQISLTSIVLGTELDHAGYSFEIIDDDNIVDLYREAILERLSRCRMVALSSTYTVHQRTLLALVDLIREQAPDLPILIGGQGLSAWRLHHDDPTVLYGAFQQADALFFGEAEGRLPQIVERLLDGRGLGDIDGVVDLRGAETPSASVSPIEVELDEALIPDWTLLERVPVNDGAIDRQGLPQVAAVEEGRGCSFRCRFCSYPLYAGFRRKSPERIVAELAAIRDAGFSTAAFSGAEFLNPIAWSQPVFEAIADARLDLDIWAYARLDLVSYRPIFAELLDRARFRYIQFGMESGDRTVLRAMGKNYDPTKMAKGAALLRQRAIEVYASLIIGYPGETETTLDNTIGVLKECDFEHVIVHALNVVPGSPLWHRRKEYDLEISPMGFWSHHSLSLRQVPGMVRRLIVALGDGTSSLLNNVTQNFTPRFFTGRPDIDTLSDATRVLQRVIEHQWSHPLDAGARGGLWHELAQRVDQVPPEMLGQLEAASPAPSAEPRLPLHPQTVF